MLRQLAIVPSDPRVATTPRPLHLLKTSPIDRLKLLFPNVISRGSLVPMHGIRRLMVDGSEGGVPRPPKPMFLAVTKSPIVGGSQQKALAIVEKLQKAIIRKNDVHVNRAEYSLNSPGGLMFATAIRTKPVPSGFQGGIRDARGSSKRGNVFAQQMTSPASVSLRLAGERLTRIAAVKPTPVTQRLQPTLQEADVNSLDIARMEYGGANVHVEEGATVVEETSPEKQRERLLFLAAVAILGFLMLRK